MFSTGRAVTQVEALLSPARNGDLYWLMERTFFNFCSSTSCFSHYYISLRVFSSCRWLGLLYWVLWIMTRAAMQDVNCSDTSNWWGALVTGFGYSHTTHVARRSKDYLLIIDLSPYQYIVSSDSSGHHCNHMCYKDMMELALEKSVNILSHHEHHCWLGQCSHVFTRQFLLRFHLSCQNNWVKYCISGALIDNGSLTYWFSLWVLAPKLTQYCSFVHMYRGKINWMVGLHHCPQ